VTVRARFRDGRADADRPDNVVGMPPGRVDSANSMRYGASADVLGQAVAGSVGETMTENSNG